MHDGFNKLVIIMQDVEEFIDSLPKDERVIVNWLRQMIFAADPRITEKLSYGVPYFSRKRRLFFLWPASAAPHQMEVKHTPPRVTFGFCYGNLLSNTQRLLVAESRKQVFTIPVYTAKEMDETLLREIINEALIVDALFDKKKKR